MYFGHSFCSRRYQNPYNPYLGNIDTSEQPYAGHAHERGLTLKGHLQQDTTQGVH